MSAEALDALWSSLAPPGVPGEINGRRAPGLPVDQPIYLAVDSQLRRHLLIRVPEDATPLQQHRETRSLEVITTRFQVGSSAEALYIDLMCSDPSQHATFSAVAEDIVRSVGDCDGKPSDAVRNALARWRSFWAVGPTGLSREDMLGLFGELWFLRRWLGVTPSTVRYWQATEFARHDFQWGGASVEVKTTGSQSLGPPIHWIASLDQLAEPEQGFLYFFSLQVTDDALATNSLHELVGSVSAALNSNYESLTSFNTKLAQRGYSPGDQGNPTRKLRILAERLYRVDTGFPRLTRKQFDPAGVPVGVVRLEYAVDPSVCPNLLIARYPHEAQSLFGTNNDNAT